MNSESRSFAQSVVPCAFSSFSLVQSVAAHVFGYLLRECVFLKGGTGDCTEITRQVVRIELDVAHFSFRTDNVYP
jgi:hypothetical protein